MIRLADLIACLEWEEVLVELKQEELLPKHDPEGMDYLLVLSKLENMDPVESNMRIIIQEVKALEWYPAEEAGELVLDVIAKNGTLNRHLECFEYLEESNDPEIANSEAEFDIRNAPWTHWLGMEIDADTFKSRTPANILCICLWGMTLENFDEREIEKERERVEKMYYEFREMPPVERSEEIKKWGTVIAMWEKSLYTY